MSYSPKYALQCIPVKTLKNHSISEKETRSGNEYTAIPQQRQKRVQDTYCPGAIDGRTLSAVSYTYIIAT